MSSVCFYFQVHQPYRLRQFSVFEVGHGRSYFDETKNSEIMRKVAHKCYLPTNQLLLELIERFQGAFRVAFSLSGVVIEQMRAYAPEVLDSFIKLAETGAVEFLGETYYHSLASIYDVDEFKEQVVAHDRLIKSIFGVSPKVFRNTELIYSDEIGKLAAKLGYIAILAEGWDEILEWRSPNFVYNVAGEPDVRLLLKNYRLSDDVAFRFSNRGWAEWPLTSEKFAAWVHRISGSGDIVNLFMDYETFGEHQWSSTGVFEFFRHLPEKILAHKDWNFLTPSQVIETYPTLAELPFKRITSWADVDRDLSAWVGNNMQQSALQQIFALREQVYSLGDYQVLDTWRKLLTSDHFYYMCTKWFADGDVHAYFSPYHSPYDAFINYMNILKDFREYFIVKSPASRTTSVNVEI